MTRSAGWAAPRRRPSRSSSAAPSGWSRRWPGSPSRSVTRSAGGSPRRGPSAGRSPAATTTCPSAAGCCPATPTRSGWPRHSRADRSGSGPHCCCATPTTCRPRPSARRSDSTRRARWRSSGQLAWRSCRRWSARSPACPTDHAVDLAALARLGRGRTAGRAGRDRSPARAVLRALRRRAGCAGAGPSDAGRRSRWSRCPTPTGPPSSAGSRAGPARCCPLPRRSPRRSGRTLPARRYPLSLMLLGLVRRRRARHRRRHARQPRHADLPDHRRGRPAARHRRTGPQPPGRHATPTATGTPTVSPSPRVFLVTPSPDARPRRRPRPRPQTPDPEPLGITLTPSSGPNDTDITVDGQGWTPGTHGDAAVLQRGRRRCRLDRLRPGRRPRPVHDDPDRARQPGHPRSAPGDRRATAPQAAQATFNATG